jgi:hypothetical protein
VCLRPWLPDLKAAVQAALAKYDINGYHEYNPDARWDSWAIYTPDDHRLLVRAAHAGDPRLYHNPVYPIGAPRPPEPGCCDGAPKGLLDLPAMQAGMVAEAAQRWDAWQELAAAHPPALPMSAFLARYRDLPQHEREPLVRHDHLAQPAVNALATRAIRGDPVFPNWFARVDPVTHFAGTREEFLRDAAASALRTGALLRLEGVWVDVYNIIEFVQIPEGGSRADAYCRYFDEYLEGLDDDIVIVHVRCHG